MASMMAMIASVCVFISVPFRLGRIVHEVHDTRIPWNLEMIYVDQGRAAAHAAPSGDSAPECLTLRSGFFSLAMFSELIGIEVVDGAHRLRLCTRC